MSRGKFIVFEGADGSGTTSQVMEMWGRLTKELGDHRLVHQTAEPSDGVVGKLIRSILKGEHEALLLKSMEFLFRTDRLDHIEREIEPALAAGKTVVCDRYYPSTLVYQSVRDTFGESVIAMRDLQEEMFSGFEGSQILRPDVIILLGTSLSTMVDRREQRDAAQELYEGLEYQEKVVQLYDAWLDGPQDRDDPKALIDGEQAINVVHEECWKIVREMIFTE